MAAPAFRAAGTATLGNTTTTVTVTKPTGTASGDLLLALVANRGANAAPSTVPSGWTLLDSAGSSTGDIMWAGLYYLIAGGSEPADYTWSGFTDSCSGGMIAVSGADTGAPFNVNAVRYNAAGATGTAGVTTTVADTLVVSAYGSYDNNAVTQLSWACATDPALTHRLESTSSGGNDSAVGAATGTKATAGATGASSYTLSASRSTVGFLLAVAPPSSGVTGTLAATLPVLTGSVAGTVSVTGALAGTLPALTGSFAGTSGDTPVTGEIAGTLPALTGTLAGAVTVSGGLTGTLPALTGSAVGQVTVSGEVAGVLPALTGSIAGQATVSGNLAATLPALAGSMVGQVAASGQVAGTLPALTGQMAGQVTVSGQITGALPALTGQIAGTIPVSGVLAGTLPALRGALAGTVGQAEQDITLNVGPPATAWATGRPERGWAAGVTTSWSAGPPTV